MGKKNKSKKEGKAEKKKNQQKTENAPPPEQTPVLDDAQKDDAPQQDAEEIPAPTETVELPPETTDINLDEDKDQQQQQQQQQHPQESEDWSMIAPHQPHVEDYESTIVQDEKKHSPTQSLSGKSLQPLLEPNVEPKVESNVEEDDDPFKNTQAEPAIDEETAWGDIGTSGDTHEETPEEPVPSHEHAEAEPEKTEEKPEKVDEGALEDATSKPTEDFLEDWNDDIEQPAEPAEPAEPEDPAEPAEPEEPAEPAKPAELAEPEETAGPEELAESAEPAAPTESAESMDMPSKDQHEEKEVEAVEGHAEPEHDQNIEAGGELPKEANNETTDEASMNNAVSSPIHAPTPAPAPAPLPSPVPSESRSVHSPAPLPSEHPLSRHGSPLAYHASPSYKYASPQMQPYNPYMMGMQGTHPPMHPGSIAPSSASFATAYHSQNMEHTPMASPHMYPRRPSVYHNGARDYYNGRMDRTLSNGSAQSQGNRLEKTSSHADDESQQEHHYLMGRIEKAMPDITRMLDSFKETKNKLQAREAEARQLQAQHEQAIMHKDFYIEALQGQMKKAATETAEEYGRLKDVISGLRMDLGNQQDKARELQGFLDTSRKNNEELTQLKSELEAQIKTLQKKIEELQMEHDRAVEEAKEHERAELATQKEELTNLFEEIRAEDETAANERYNEREKELLDEQAAMKSAWEEKQREMEEMHDSLRTEHGKAISEKHAELEKNIADLEATRNDLQAVRDALVNKSADLEAKERELDATQEELKAKLLEVKQAQDELHSKQEELQAARAELQSTLDELAARKSDLDDKHKELEDAHKQHSEHKDQLLESHAAELGALRDAHSTELSTLRDTHSAEIDNLRSAHSTISKEREERLEQLLIESRQFAEKEKTWAAEKSTLQRHLNEKLDELASIEREKDSLERDDMVREKHLQSAVDEMRRTIDNMENDREKLRKTLTSLGEATDLKTSKGDQFFVESFNQLCRLIVELSKEHFSYLPIDPPKDILEKIPPEMPSFLDNTSASRELRSAYIQHVISKTLTYRIFQPFLFTLGRRYDKADTFFQVLSMDIRRKSVRREAFWRQQTLKAAYTTSDAKQSINVVAAVIVDEIVDHIKHFADPKQLDSLLSGIRRIVKLAAETWRHARVERELVLATMPAPESDGDANEGWDEYTCGRNAEVMSNGKKEPGKSGRHVLLRVFPRIYREAAHEDFADDKEKMNACVYFPGMVLYSDSPSVVARREEQGQKSGNVSASSSNDAIRSAAS